jgi:sugar/nucleoside kinase (ribokinase family)
MPPRRGFWFAAAFFVWLQREGNPWIAARFANCVAAGSVTRTGLSGTPSPEEIARCQWALEG